ncbi:rubrerythrin [Planomicrobium sp. HSC-17F08]|nr:rubrerythrin [Planomicrobium sp. HSC-17F08]
MNLPSFIESYMAEYKMENKTPVISTMRLIHTFSSITILVGVLGTFIGLVISLAGIDPVQIDQSIVTILSGVHTAFYTSIAGIIFSIAINLHSKVKNNEHLMLQIMLKIENYIYTKDKETSDYYVVEAIKDVKTAVNNMGQSFLAVSKFSQEFKEATDNLNSFNTSFSQNTTQVSELFEDMKTITKTFNDRSTQIHDDFGKLFMYFEGQNGFHTSIQQAFQHTAADIKEYVTHQANFLSKLTVSNEESRKQYESLLNATDTKVQVAYQEMSKFFTGISAHISQLIEQNTQHINKNTALTETVYKQIKEEQAALLRNLEEALSQKRDFEAFFKKVAMGSGNSGKGNQNLTLVVDVIEKNIGQLNKQIEKMNELYERKMNVPETLEGTPSMNTFQSLDSTMNEMKGILEILTLKLQEGEVQLSK